MGAQADLYPRCLVWVSIPTFKRNILGQWSRIWQNHRPLRKNFLSWKKKPLQSYHWKFCGFVRWENLRLLTLVNSLRDNSKLHACYRSVFNSRPSHTISIALCLGDFHGSSSFPGFSWAGPCWIGREKFIEILFVLTRYKEWRGYSRLLPPGMTTEEGCTIEWFGPDDVSDGQMLKGGQNETCLTTGNGLRDPKETPNEERSDSVSNTLPIPERESRLFTFTGPV